MSLPPDTKICRGDENFPQKVEKSQEEGEHRGDKYKRHWRGCLEVKKCARKQDGNDGTDQQGSHRTQRDRSADQSGANFETLKFEMQSSLICSRSIDKPGFQDSRTVDHSAESVCHDGEKRADAR